MLKLDIVPLAALGPLGILLGSTLLACTSGAATATPEPSSAAATATPATVGATLVLDGANVVVLDPTPHVERDRSIVADGERIVWVGPRSERPQAGGATVIDIEGRFVIAGLSDMHAHLPAESAGPAEGDDASFGLQTYLELQLAAGVTSIRSMRGDPSHAGVRAAIVEGTRVGPDLMLASTPVATEALSAADAQQVVQGARRDGADFIKLLGVGDVESYRNLMGAADAAGIPVAGHLPASVEPGLATQLGQQSIEHLGGVLGAVRADAATASGVAAALAQPSLFHCPTLHWYALGLGVYTPDAFADDVALGSVPEATRQAWDVALADRRAKTGGPPTGQTFEPIGDRLAALRLLHEAGAQLVVGPDSGGAYGLPGSAVHAEMRLFAEAGIPPAEVLRAATMNAAALRGAEDEGEVAVGHLANLAVLAADPLEDIGNVSSVQLTVHRGRIAWQAAAADASAP